MEEVRLGSDNTTKRYHQTTHGEIKMTLTEKVRHALIAGMSVDQATAFVGCDRSLTNRVRRQLEAEERNEIPVMQFVTEPKEELKPRNTYKARMTFKGEPVLTKQVFEYIKENPGWAPQEVAQLLKSDKHSADTIAATVSALVRAKMVAKDPSTRGLTALVVRYKSPYSEMTKRNYKPKRRRGAKRVKQSVEQPGAITEVKPAEKPSLLQRIGNWLWR